MLPGDNFKDVANKACELVKSGFNPVPHFPARSIKNLAELKDFVNICKDGGTKQALVIGGSKFSRRSWKRLWGFTGISKYIFDYIFTFNI